MPPRFKFTPSVYLFLYDKEKILLQRRCNSGYRDGEYGVPSGHLEGNETLRQALIREVKEEIGISIKRDDLKFIHLLHRMSSWGGERQERADIFFTTQVWEGEVSIKEPNKCDDLNWFSIRELPPNTIDYIQKTIELVEKEILYSESGWE